MTECEQAFEDLKTYLSSLPLLGPFKLGEELFLYLAVFAATVSVALVKEEDGVQRPIYFTSQALRCRRKVPSDGKASLTLVTTTSKLKPYFQARIVIVLTDKPLWRAMSSLKPPNE